MDFRTLSESEKEHYADLMIQPINSVEDLKEWVNLFLGLDMPLGHVDPDSNSSPIEAMWEIYSCVKDNRGEDNPGYIMLSAREGFKTLSASILEVILLVQYSLTIAHMSAIKDQSSKAIKYINYFFGKIGPLLEQLGWENKSQNKMMIEWKNPEGEDAYIQVVVATMTGSNCISGDSIVYTADGEKRAAEIRPNDSVLSWNMWDKKDVFLKVKGIGLTRKYGKKITFSNGSNIILSDDHPIFTQRGWGSASTVRIGDRVKGTNELNPKRSKIFIDNKVNRNFRQLILGTVLGDASIDRIPSGKCRYSVFHSASHLDYLKETKKLFDANGIRCAIRPDGSGYKLLTKTHPIFNEYRDLFYKGKTKVVTENILRSLTPEGLAYWIMDDGSGNPERIGSRKDRRVSMATCCFTEKENQTIVSYLKSLGLSCKVKTVSNQSKRVYPFIELGLESSRILSQWIKPFFVKSLMYKLLPSKEEAEQSFTIDRGETVNKQKSYGYVWSDNKLRNLKAGRDFIKYSKSQLSLSITRVESVGLQDFVDISIKSEDKRLHCFYANNVLVHNSAHTNLMFIDEIDVVKDPQAYEEAKLIPGYSKGIHPVTVKLSTRKFAFGLMQKEISRAQDPLDPSGDKILRWNILDVTEKCPPQRHKAKQLKLNIYVAKSLPLRQIDPEDFRLLPQVEQDKWELVKDAFGGCRTCKLLPVCKTRLAFRPESNVKGLYKPIGAVINTFKKTDPDRAEAQLMCWKPSNKGMVYPRFENVINTGNVITLEHAWETLMGEPPAKSSISDIDLIYKMQQLGIRFVAGVDWGYTHPYAIVIFAMIPNGEVWIVDCYSQEGLEFSDCLEIAITYRDKYNVEKWFCDQAQPSHVKSFTRNRMKSPKFTKDVMGGISAIRSKIVDGSGRRYLKILNIDANQKVITAFFKHHFKLGQDGNPTLEPDDDAGIADIMDPCRYVGQNMFPVKGTQKPEVVWLDDRGRPLDPNSAEAKEKAQAASQHENQMREELAKHLDVETVISGTGKKGGFFWSV